MVPMHEVQCHSCELRTRHPHSTLRRIIQLQSVLSEDERRINYACPRCNKLTLSRVLPATLFDEVVLGEFPVDLNVYAVTLACVKTGCESPVILLAPVKGEIREEDLLTHIRTNWSTHGALCAANFPPLHPYEVRIWEKLEA